MDGRRSTLLRSLLLTFALLLACSPFALGQGDPHARLPLWMETRLAAQGVHLETDGLRVERTLLAGGVTRVSEEPLSSLPRDDPFATGVAAAPAPEPADGVLVGQLTQHSMLQLGECPGYGAEQLDSGVALVDGASWPVGVHLALGAASGGAAVSTGGDPAANLVAIAGEDTGMSLAAGQLSISEERVIYFGQCVLLLGTMSGTGVWEFN